jgi:NADPH-dependent FMN reductase
MVLELDDIPLYNEDVEAAGAPASVVQLRDAIRKADGLATPEYNYGVPGVLKNTIDWLSRPPRDSALDGKVASPRPNFLGKPSEFSLSGHSDSPEWPALQTCDRRLLSTQKQ